MLAPEGAAARPPVVWSALATYGTNVAVGVVSLVNALITARVLGPSGRGSVVFLIAIASLVAAVASLGVQEATANLASTRAEVRPALATNSLVFSLLVGFVAIPVVLTAATLVPTTVEGVDRPLLTLALAAVPLQVAQLCLLSLVRADYGFTVANVAWLAGPVTSIAANTALVLFGRLTVAAVIAGWILGLVLGLGVMAYYIIRRMGGFGAPDARLARRTLSFGLKSHAGGVLFLANLRLDHWLVGAMAGPRELGLYSVAVTWTEVMFFLPTSLAAVLRPDLVRADRAGASSQAARAFRLATLATAPVAVGMFLAAPVLCTGIFGRPFSGSIDDLRMLTFGAFGVLALKLLGHTLTAQDRPTLETVGLGGALATMVAVDLVCIPWLGGFGAAIGSTASYTAGGVIVALVFFRTLGGSPRDLVPRLHEVSHWCASLRRAVSRRVV